jgi:hypothetical protein
MNKIEQYIRDGFVILRDVVSKDYISDLREIGFKVLEEKRQAGQLSVFNTEFVKHEKLINVPFLKNVVSSIRDVLGDDYVTISQYSMNANALSPVWHTDSQSQRNAEYLFNKDYLISKCGLYLQEHDPIYGGGMEIIPYSHRPTFLGYKSRSKSGRINNWRWQAIQFRNEHLLPKKLPKLNLGDVLLFHGMLVHRASQPDLSKAESVEKYGIKNPPRDKYKFMIQWEVSPNNSFVPVYLAHQKLRALREGAESLFSEALEVKYPDDYPEGTRRLIEENGCKIRNYGEAPDSYLESSGFTMEDGTPIVFLYKNKQA